MDALQLILKPLKLSDTLVVLEPNADGDKAMDMFIIKCDFLDTRTISMALNEQDIEHEIMHLTQFISVYKEDLKDIQNDILCTAKSTYAYK